MSNLAVIDLGTNTFHLLIVKRSGSKWEEVYRKRVFVNIAEEGIDTLGADCYRRGIETILDLSSKLREFEVKQTSIFGTAALRTATNGPSFQAEVAQKTGLKIKIIDGAREAELIAKGTKSIVDMKVGNYLIMDIGGGSVEFILIQNDKESYAQSFPIGITSLYNQVPHGEPISQDEIININAYLSEQLKPLEAKISKMNIDGLVGASGSYEVLEKILSGSIAKDRSRRFPIAAVLEQINRILKMDFEQRLLDPNIPKQRAKLIVIAFLLMKYVMNASSIDSLVISPYALKEGALIELMNLD